MGGTKSHICCSLSNQDGGGTVPVLAVDKEVGHTTLSGVRGRTHLSFACLKVEERQTLWTSAVSATSSAPFLDSCGVLVPCAVALLCSALLANNNDNNLILATTGFQEFLPIYWVSLAISLTGTY